MDSKRLRISGGWPMSDLMKTYPILKIIDHGPGLRSLYFEKTFEVQPGQFINLWLPGVDEKPFSVSRITVDFIEVSIKAYGPFSQAIMQCKPGQRLGLRGPFGRPFSLHNNALLIGGGIGIAPLRILGDTLSQKGFNFSYLIGAVTAHELLFPEEMKRQAATRIYTDDGSLGKKGRVTADIEQILDSEKIEFVYAAGPEIMFVVLKPILDQRRLPYEFCMERYMKCGIGICGQCVLDDSGIRLCVEGPVLNQDDLKQVTELGSVHRDASGRRVR